MSQERTEQRDRAEDKKLIEDIQAAYGNERGRTFVTRAAQAMEDYMAEIDRLNATIAGQAEAIREQTAKVQERDEEIIRQRERADRLDSELHKQNCRNQDQAEEIERLRAEMQSSADDLRELMEVAYRDCPYEAQKIADRLVAALKGAE